MLNLILPINFYIFIKLNKINLNSMSSKRSIILLESFLSLHVENLNAYTHTFFSFYIYKTLWLHYLKGNPNGKRNYAFLTAFNFTCFHVCLLKSVVKDYNVLDFHLKRRLTLLAFLNFWALMFKRVLKIWLTSKKKRFS